MQKKTLKRIGVFVAAAVVFGLLYWKVAPLLDWEYLASKEAALRQYQQDHWGLTFGIGYLLYASVTAFPIPGATVLTLAYGWYFGWLPGVILVSLASTTGATLAFLMSRYFFREAVRKRFSKQFKAIETSLKREGPLYLFMLRLIPAVPFFALNTVMGLMPMSTVTYWWVSQIGMLPATIIFVFAGSSVPDLATLAEKGASGVLSPPLIISLVLLGVFPIAVKKLSQWWRGKPIAPEKSA